MLASFPPLNYKSATLLSFPFHRGVTHWTQSKHLYHSGSSLALIKATLDVPESGNSSVFAWLS